MVEHSTDKRKDPRFNFITQALVTIISLPSRAYEACNISLGGMFLAFKDPRSTWMELEMNGIGPSAHVEIAFAALLPDARHRFRVRARIARITKHGIGVQFARRNPPQLGPLRVFFPDAGWEVTSTNPANRASKKGSERTQTLSKPSDASGWQDWELED